MTTEPDPERDDGTLPRFWTGRRIALAVTVPVMVVFLIAVATSSAFVKKNDRYHWLVDSRFWGTHVIDSEWGHLDLSSSPFGIDKAHMFMLDAHMNGSVYWNGHLGWRKWIREEGEPWMKALEKGPGIGEAGTTP